MPAKAVPIVLACAAAGMITTALMSLPAMPGSVSRAAIAKADKIRAERDRANTPIADRLPDGVHLGPADASRPRDSITDRLRPVQTASAELDARPIRVIPIVPADRPAWIEQIRGGQAPAKAPDRVPQAEPPKPLVEKTAPGEAAEANAARRVATELPVSPAPDAKPIAPKEEDLLEPNQAGPPVRYRRRLAHADHGGDICARHGLHRITTHGGRSWRCSRG